MFGIEFNSSFPWFDFECLITLQYINLNLNCTRESRKLPALNVCRRCHSFEWNFECLNTDFTFTISSNERRTRFAGNSSLALHKQLRLTMTTIQNTVATFMFAECFGLLFPLLLLLLTIFGMRTAMFDKFLPTVLNFGMFVVFIHSHLWLLCTLKCP